MKFNDYLNKKLENPKIKKAFDEYDIPMRLAMAIVEAREKVGKQERVNGRDEI